MFIESPHELGFRFDFKYYFINYGHCVLSKIRRDSKMFPMGFIYEFQSVT